MSDYNEISGAGTKVIRAAFAAALSDREDIDIASSPVYAPETLTQKRFLSFIDYSPMGYPMGDELIPLADLYSKEQDPKDSSDVDESEPLITNLDIQLDDTKAHLHDKLFNISPNLTPTISLTDEHPILNRVYEKFLHHSEFAGKVGANTSELEKAKSFLFPENEDGIPVQSEAYKLYIEYEDRYFELNLKISEASSSDSSFEVEALKKKLERLQAEWITIGRKNEVEAALKVLNTSDAEAGYEDERNAFIGLLESRQRERLSSTQNYAAVTLSPLKPLIEPDEDGLWRKIALTASDVSHYLNPEVCQLFDIGQEELDYVLKNFKSASMEYLHVLLNREWLSKDFLTARYWNSPNSFLSDGKGGGESPTSISSAYFIKSAELHMHAGIDVNEVGSVQSGNNSKAIIAYNTVRTPLIQALIEKESESENTLKQKKLLNIKTINKLKTVKRLQASEVSKLRTAKQMQISTKLLHTRFNPITKKNRFAQLKKSKFKAKPAITPISRLRNIKLRPQLVINQGKNQDDSQSINVTGRIKHNNFFSVRDLSLNYTLQDKNSVELETQTVKLAQSGNDITFRFKATNNQSAQSILILLTDNYGNELLTKKISFSGKDKSVSLAWEADTGSVEVVLSSSVTPTLFAYGLELLPKAPNPDHSLFND